MATTLIAAIVFFAIDPVVSLLLIVLAISVVLNLCLISAVYDHDEEILKLNDKIKKLSQLNSQQ